MRLTRSLWAARATLSKNVLSTAANTDTKQVAGHFEPAGRSKRRTEILSAELCNQAIELLRSQNALPAAGTCDIIDLNPGISIWSQALNNTLKPRRHVLLEPEKSVLYAPQIDPLLKERYSSYALVEDKHTLMIKRVHESLSPEFVDAQKREPDTVQQANPHLIVTANLSGKRGRGQFHNEKWFLYSLTRAVRVVPERDWAFLELGLPKFLLWVPDATVNTILPRGTQAQTRTHLNRSLEAQFDMRQVVSTIPNNKVEQVIKPWYGAELDSSSRVRELQKRSGLIPPRGREQPPVQPYSMAVVPTGENLEKLKRLQVKPKVVMQFTKLWEEVEQLYPEWHDRYVQHAVEIDLLRKLEVPKELAQRLKTEGFAYIQGQYKRYDKLDPIQVRFMKTWTHLKTRHGHYVRVDRLARRRVALEEELLNIRKAHPNDQAPYKARLGELLPEFDKINQTWQKMFKDNRSSYLKAVDDYRAVLHGILQWNNRTYEPLLSHKRDFFPPKSTLTLLELTPKLEFAHSINTPERQICFDYINIILDIGIYPTVESLLERLIGPKDTHLYNEFLAKVPALTDPLRKGYHDLSEVRARVVPIEHLIDLAIAYESWPYRRDIVHILEKTDPYKSEYGTF